MGKNLTDGFERTLPKSPKKKTPGSFCMTFGGS